MMRSTIKLRVTSGKQLFEYLEHLISFKSQTGVEIRKRGWSPENFTILTHSIVYSYTLFYRQLGCLAFSLRLWPKIKQLLRGGSNIDHGYR